MAINDTSGVQQNVAQAPVPPTPTASAPETAFPSAARSWVSPSSMLGSGIIDRNRGSEALSKITTALKKYIDDHIDKKWEITLLPIDNNNEPVLRFSTLVVAVRNQEMRNNLVAYHTLIIEATNERPAPRFETPQGQQQVEITRVASDAFDNVLVGVVFARVKTAFPQSKLIESDACVVPRSFNPEDTDALHRLLVNSLSATFNELQVLAPDFKDVQVSPSSRDTSLRVKLRFEKTTISDAVNNPVRQDVQVDFSTQSHQNQQTTSLNNGDREQEVSRLSGFINVVYSPALPQNTSPYAAAPYGVAPGYRDPRELQKYAAQLVITDLATLEASTLPSQLLALASAATLRDNNNWWAAFYQHGGGSKKTNIKDIGAVGFQVNLFPGQQEGFQRINTTKSDWSPSELGFILGTAFQPGLAVSLDVPECGPQSWYTRVFAVAASTTPTRSANAREAILQAANYLTNGHFGKLFNDPNAIFLDSGSRVHLGTYVTADGERCDIRDVDYLAVLNLVGDKDPAVIQEWSNTFNATHILEAVRLATRKRLLMNLVGQAEVTSFAQRVTFRPEFINALTQSLANAGLTTGVQTPMNSGDFTGQTNAGSNIASALLPQGTVTPFVQAYANTNNPNGGSYSFGQRWS